MQFNNVYLQHQLFINLPQILAAHINVDNVLLVSDANTSFAYQLYDLPILVKRHVCLFALPKVTLKAAKDLGNIAKDYDAILAVGSGSINDLAKYAAYHAGIPYVIMASAPSMNGYLSGNASLYDGGIKQSFVAAPPRALVADLGVLQNAPATLIAAGVGDVLCRSSAQYDMLLAHYFTGADYPNDIFAQMLELERDLLQRIDSEEDYIAELMACLLYGGVAMQEFGSSAPASGSEHMLVHLLEMLEPEVAENFHHGQLVGAASVMMLQLQQQHDFAQYSPKQFDDAALAQYFDADLLLQWRNEYVAKLANVKSDVDMLALQQHLQSCHLLSAAQLAHYLQKVGGEIDLGKMGAEKIGFAPQQQSTALYNAAFTRRRFTILDLI